ncbi:MAG: zinc carboxypeptidase [Balneolaceae bacterium]|nr:zinc carboxypeptidase [Balneolaceae bacterium]
MRKIANWTFLLILILSGAVSAQVQSPAEFLGYELGDEWTPHYKVYNYFQHVAENSDMVAMEDYGLTYEGRELTHVVVTSRQNHANLEEIRTNNLKLVGLESGEPTENTKAIVWMSYNVHGNETSSSEAAMHTIYELVTEKTAWLNDVVVIIDPMVNPDGRDQYVNWNRTVTGAFIDADPISREHMEPWPGGRTNHYHFDLNRDWAWQTQVESQQRKDIYFNWMPHVHVDFHEQGYNSPYYFAPAAKPFHKAITDWQKEYQTMIGRNNAKYFDEEGWMYFTKERFDLFYPSYGDTWPTFNGAIGMTYEQAGHSRAGLAIETAEGDTLTLRDRLIHHSTSGLSTVEITAMNADRVVDEFGKFFDDVRNNGSGEYKTYIVKKSSNPDKVAMMMRYLIDQNIQVQAAASDSRANGFDYATGQTGRVNVEEGDFVISTKQPMGNLVRVLFEPSPELEDSVTYDITAWEMHYAYGVDGFALTGDIATKAVEMENMPIDTEMIERPYAYIAKWNSLDDLKFLASLLKEGVRPRYTMNPFSIDGKEYATGTLVITRNGNHTMGARFDDIVKTLADAHNREIHAVTTGFVDSGNDFGSSSVQLIDPPKIVLVSGEGTSSNMVGHIWHFFDQQISYPISLVNMDDLAYMDWSKVDVLIMPSGSYSRTFGESGLNDLKEWIRGGGRLIAVEGANRFLAGQDGFALQRKSGGDESNDDPEANLRIYGNSERDFITNFNAGSVYELDLDTTNPLVFGYGDKYMSLKLGSTAYEYLDNGWNAAVAKSGTPRSGFVGAAAQKNLEHSLSFGFQNMGSGQVIYMIDNPFYRGFWHNGKLLIGNAVFFSN